MRQLAAHSLHSLAQLAISGSLGNFTQNYPHISQALAQASQQIPIMGPPRAQMAWQIRQNSAQSRQALAHWW